MQARAIVISLWTFVALLFVASPVVPGQASQGPQQTSGHIIGVESNLVLVPLHVTRGGAAVPGLGVEAFEVLEDGVAQKVALVDGYATASESSGQPHRVPKEVIVLVDLSLGASAWRRIEGETLRTDIFEALAENFQVSVYGFGNSIRQYAEPTQDPAVIARAFRTLPLFEKRRSRLHEAIFTMILHAAKRAGTARTRLVVFSHGWDSTRLDLERAIRAAWSSGISIYPVEVARPTSMPTTVLVSPTRGSLPRMDQRRSTLVALRYLVRGGGFRDLGRHTGGKRYRIESMDPPSLLRLTKALSQLARTEYLVGYYPRNVDEEITTHKVRVRLADKKTGKLRGGRRLVAH